MARLLRYAEALIDGSEKPESAVPLMKAGIWWPGQGVIGVEAWKKAVGFGATGQIPPSVSSADISPTRGEIGLPQLDEPAAFIVAANLLEERELSPTISLLVGEMPDRAEGGMRPPHSTVALCFYRALVQSGETKPVEALIEALTAEGLTVLPVFVSSLKDVVSIGTLQAIFDDVPPTVVMNATGFAVSAPGADRKPTVLEFSDAPVLQVIFSGSSRAAWEASPQGLMARDLAMNVALPEVDGRILSRAVSFKAAAVYDTDVEANIVGHEPAGRPRRLCRQTGGQLGKVASGRAG
jgi:cobaltochelatase CobN